MVSLIKFWKKDIINKMNRLVVLLALAGMTTAIV